MCKGHHLNQEACACLLSLGARVLVTSASRDLGDEVHGAAQRVALLHAPLLVGLAPTGKGEEGGARLSNAHERAATQRHIPRSEVGLSLICDLLRLQDSTQHGL